MLITAIRKDEQSDEAALWATLLRSLEIRIAKAFMDAVRRLRGHVDVEHVTALLKEGRIAEAINLVDAEMVASGLKPVMDEISSATLDSGQAAITALEADPVMWSIGISFGPTNPLAVSWLQNYELTRIHQMTADTLEAVKTAITAGVIAGRSSASIAADFKGAIGLTETQVKAVDNYRRMLETADRTALRRQLRDRRFDPSVENAASGKKPLTTAQIDRMVDRYRERYLKFRATTIARTEAHTALNAGNHLAWQQIVSDGKVSANQVRRDWNYVHDKRVRHAHATLPSLNPDGVGLNQPFASELGPILYPGDPNADPANTINCRCVVTARILH
jgi:hypothetical protein